MFGKMFVSELDGSIVEEAAHVRLLWHYLIMLSDREGNLDMTHEALARRVNLPLEQVRDAIHRLSLPDPKSRTPDEEGRRIVPLDPRRDWGWRLVNYEKYRGLRNEVDRTEYMREYRRQRRAEGKDLFTPVHSVHMPVHTSSQCSPIAEADVDTEAEAEKRGRGVGRGNLVGSSEPEPTTNSHLPEVTRERELNTELNWRLVQCWEMHLEARARFFATRNGFRPSRTPTLKKSLAKIIRAALLEHDRDFLEPDQREEWVRNSAVRAAGIGIFLDPWCTASVSPNKMGVDEGARYFLQSDRAWRQQQGRLDPIPRFAEHYWSDKDEQEQKHRREQLAAAALQRALSDGGAGEVQMGLAPEENEPN